MNAAQSSILILTLLIARSAVAESLVIDQVVLSLIDKSDVAAEESGRVTEISVKVGQDVTTGDLLGRLDDRDARLRRDQMQLEYKQAVQVADNDVELRAARESLTLAELDLKRARESITRYAKSVSDAQIDRLEVIVTRAKLDVEQAQRDLDLSRIATEAAMNRLHIAERGVQRRRIVAPISGTVVTIEGNKGEWVEGGATVFRIVNVDRLRAEGFVEFENMARDLRGRDAVFSTRPVEGHQSEHRGIVNFVSPEVNRVNGQVRVWAVINNRSRSLRPGIVGRMSIDQTSPLSPKAIVR